MERGDKVIVTGGAGYIGSHTVVELITGPGVEVVSIDNFANSSPGVFDRIEKITGCRVRNHQVDLCDLDAVKRIVSAEKGIIGIIHFAAFKSVPESMHEPYKYYHNNTESLLNMLKVVVENEIPSFIFSSSCSVYGNISQLPVSEDTSFGRAESPYAFTKQMGERIVEDHARTYPWLKAVSLRYFNPVGAHTSALIGEDPINPPTSLVPVITRTASGKNRKLIVHGNDYDTRDGSCIRDYVHVSDIAYAHVRALQHAIESLPGYSVFNLGTGNGISVLEAIEAFERVTGMKLEHAIGPRREGDVAAIYSDTRRSQNVLKWTARHDLDEMMRSAWAWEQQQS